MEPYTEPLPAIDNGDLYGNSNIIPVEPCESNPEHEKNDLPVTSLSLAGSQQPSTTPSTEPSQDSYSQGSVLRRSRRRSTRWNLAETTEKVDSDDDDYGPDAADSDSYEDNDESDDQDDHELSSDSSNSAKPTKKGKQKRTMRVKYIRNRMVWTPELHELFLAALRQLGDQAVPSQIMKVMQVKGLSRAHIASHLQKHRLKSKLPSTRARVNQKPKREDSPEDPPTNISVSSSFTSVDTTIPEEDGEQAQMPTEPKDPACTKEATESDRNPSSQLSASSTQRDSSPAIHSPTTKNVNSPPSQPKKRRGKQVSTFRNNGQNDNDSKIKGVTESLVSSSLSVSILPYSFKVGERVSKKRAREKLSSNTQSPRHHDTSRLIASDPSTSLTIGGQVLIGSELSAKTNRRTNLKQKRQKVMDSSGGDGDADAMRRLRCEEKIDFDAPVTPLKAAGGSMMCVSATNSALSPHLMAHTPKYGYYHTIDATHNTRTLTCEQYSSQHPTSSQVHSTTMLGRYYVDRPFFDSTDVNGDNSSILMPEFVSEQTITGTLEPESVWQTNSEMYGFPSSVIDYTSSAGSSADSSSTADTQYWSTLSKDPYSLHSGDERDYLPRSSRSHQPGIYNSCDYHYNTYYPPNRMNTSYVPPSMLQPIMLDHFPGSSDVYLDSYIAASWKSE